MRFAVNFNQFVAMNSSRWCFLNVKCALLYVQLHPFKKTYFLLFSPKCQVLLCFQLVLSHQPLANMCMFRYFQNNFEYLCCSLHLFQFQYCKLIFSGNQQNARKFADNPKYPRISCFPYISPVGYYASVVCMCWFFPLRKVSVPVLYLQAFLASERELFDKNIKTTANSHKWKNILQMRLGSLEEVKGTVHAKI